MKPAPENTYGWTHYEGISDMSDQPTLREQIRSKNIPFTQTILNMGGIASEPAYVITYLSPTSKQNVSVLVVPTAEIDSWSEEYYYFVGLDTRAVAEMKWSELLDYMRQEMWKGIKKNISHPTPCPSCGKLDINKSDKYTDGDGRVRCSGCHNPRS